MDQELISEVKKKKEFSGLPASLVERALVMSKEDVKFTRALLRKYFGVFLTNKVLKLGSEDILKSHISSKERDYSEFYEKVFLNINPASVFDIGCGVNGFSYGILEKIFPGLSYTGVEAVGQLVEKTNQFFEEKHYKNAKVIWEDIFDFKKMETSFRELDSPRVIFLFQVIDALETFERDSSKKLLLMLWREMSNKDLIVISMPMKSISGRKNFEAKRSWLKFFLEENFSVEETFLGSERIFKCRKK